MPRALVVREALRSLAAADSFVQIALWDDPDELRDEDLVDAWSDAVERIRAALTELEE